MPILSLVRSRWNRARLSALVDRVAARVKNPVWQRVRDRVSGMGIHEARGYIRARSATILDREIGILNAEEPTLAGSQLELVRQAVQQRVIRRLLFDNLRNDQDARVRPADRRRAA